MSGTSPIRSVEQFLEEWRRWLRIVALHARRRRARRRINEDEYHRLQANLSACCLRFSREAGEGAQHWQQAAALLGPWPTLDSLESEQPTRLLEVLTRCEQLQLQLRQSNEGPRVEDVDLWKVSVGILFVAVAVVSFWLWHHAAVMDEIIPYGQNMLRSFEIAVRWSSFVERFSVVTVVLVLLGIHLAYKAQRS